MSGSVFLCLLVLIHWYLIKLVALDCSAPTAQWISKKINMLNIVCLSRVRLCCCCRPRYNAGTSIRQARQGVSPELAMVCGRNVHRLGPDLIVRNNNHVAERFYSKIISAQQCARGHHATFWCAQQHWERSHHDKICTKFWMYSRRDFETPGDPTLFE